MKQRPLLIGVKVSMIILTLCVWFLVIRFVTFPQVRVEEKAESRNPFPSIKQSPPDEQTIFTPMEEHRAGFPDLQVTRFHLSIPLIHLDAMMEAVSQLHGGERGIPISDPWKNVALYQFGAAPGFKGTAVISGRLDKIDGTPAVFWNLHRLKKDDSVFVKDGTQTFTYRVTRTEIYKPEKTPMQEIFLRHDGYFLNMITYAGPPRDLIASRLVVYTKMV